MNEPLNLETDKVLMPIINPPIPQLNLKGLYALWHARKIHAGGDGIKGVDCWMVVTNLFVGLCKDNKATDLIRIAKVSDIQKIWLYDPKVNGATTITIAIQMTTASREPTLLFKLGHHPNNLCFTKPPGSHLELLQVINKIYKTYKGTNVPCERVHKPLFGNSQAGPFKKPNGYVKPIDKKKRWNKAEFNRVAPLNEPPPESEPDPEPIRLYDPPMPTAPEEVSQKEQPDERILTDMKLDEPDLSSSSHASESSDSRDSELIDNQFGASDNTSPAYNYSSPSNFSPVKVNYPVQAPAYPGSYERERESVYLEQPPPVSKPPVFTGDPPSVHLHLVMDSNIPDGRLSIDDNLPAMSPVGKNANDIGFTAQPPPMPLQPTVQPPPVVQMPSYAMPEQMTPAQQPISVTPPHPSKFTSRRGVGPGGPGGGSTPYGESLENNGPTIFAHGHPVIGLDAATRLSEPSPRGISRSRSEMEQTNTTIKTIIEPPTPHSESVQVVEYSKGQVVAVSRDSKGTVTEGFEKFMPPADLEMSNSEIADGSPTYEDGFARGFTIAMESLKNERPRPSLPLSVDRGSSPTVPTHREWAQDRAINAKLQLLKESFNESPQRESHRRHRDQPRRLQNSRHVDKRSARDVEEYKDKLFFESISRGSEADALQSSVFGGSSSVHSSVPRQTVQRQASVRSPRRKKTEQWPPKSKSSYWKTFLNEWEDHSQITF